MKDRLDELLKNMTDVPEENNDDKNPYMGEEEEDDVPITPQAVIFEEEPVLENFLRRAMHIREDIDCLKDKVKKFSEQQKTLVSAMRCFSVTKNDDSTTQEIKLHAERIYKQLDALSKQVKQTEAENDPLAAATRIQRSQHATLFLHFQKVMNLYNETLVSKQEKCKQFIIRQLEVSGWDTPEEQVDEMVEQGRWEVFNENILHEVKITRAQLSDIEQQHKELVHLESSMSDLRDFFLQVYLMVQEQGEHIENIQAQVEKTRDFTVITKETIKKAARYRRKNPIERICCFCCPWKK